MTHERLRPDWRTAMTNRIAFVKIDIQDERAELVRALHALAARTAQTATEFDAAPESRVPRLSAIQIALDQARQTIATIEKKRYALEALKDAARVREAGPCTSGAREAQCAS
jgi:hypothetical protein